MKSQDVQRAQIEEVFKHLKDGVELPETEPSNDLHQNTSARLQMLMIPFSSI